MERLTLEEGTYLVKLARKAIEVHLSGKIPKAPGNVPERLRMKSGVFVTLTTYPERSLRGCIGYPMPLYELAEATIMAAVASAFQDPRFPPLGPEELDEVVVEVSVLTPPEEIKYSDPRELPNLINIGVDGLIIETGVTSGLLLPQVPVEYNWGPEEYLMHLCMKAGLPSTYWLTGRAKIYKFTAQIFEEESPRGKVVEKKLSICKS
ncbi:MAG: TIGR00296 family protein [Nitrososphaeria archaeon]|nr:TIGR00296 family protein [Aigarchaeota archaeon]MCX8187056.1 TIGR00296 family protein [Nitrososphaeria archaeon]